MVSFLSLKHILETFNRANDIIVLDLDFLITSAFGFEARLGPICCLLGWQCFLCFGSNIVNSYWFSDRDKYWNGKATCYSGHWHPCLARTSTYCPIKHQTFLFCRQNEFPDLDISSDVAINCQKRLITKDVKIALSISDQSYFHFSTVQINVYFQKGFQVNGLITDFLLGK